MSEYSHTFKFMILGDSAVGKTSILSRIVENWFAKNYKATLGLDFRTTEITVNDKKIKLQIWDTAGQERFRSITKTLFKTPDGIVLVYDVTNEASFSKINYWIEQIKSNAKKNISLVLLGNK